MFKETEENYYNEERNDFIVKNLLSLKREEDIE